MTPTTRNIKAKQEVQFTSLAIQVVYSVRSTDSCLQVRFLLLLASKIQVSACMSITFNPVSLFTSPEI